MENPWRSHAPNKRSSNGTRVNYLRFLDAPSNLWQQHRAAPPPSRRLPNVARRRLHQRWKPRPPQAAAAVGRSVTCVWDFGSKLWGIYGNIHPMENLENVWWWDKHGWILRHHWMVLQKIGGTVSPSLYSHTESYLHNLTGTGKVGQDGKWEMWKMWNSSGSSGGPQLTWEGAGLEKLKQLFSLLWLADGERPDRCQTRLFAACFKSWTWANWWPSYKWKAMPRVKYNSR